ncbi:hypothetical protein Efla_004851 [Eimeria flavescens]
MTMGETPEAGALPELYPQCVSLRKELDALLSTLTSPSTTSVPSRRSNDSGAASSGCVFGVTPKTSGAGQIGRGSICNSVAKLQRFSALTRQFCMLVLKLQEALADAKKGNLSRNMHALWERRVQDLVADAESFRREAEGRMNMEQQRVEDAMRERKALLGESSIGRRWGDMRHTELMYAKERDRLQESRTMLDSVLAQGWGIVGQLVSQNAALKNAKRKVLDMASSAGVASTLLGAVGRRQQGDKWLVYGGMIATLIFFFVVYRIVHCGSVFGFLASVEVGPEDGTTLSSSESLTAVNHSPQRALPPERRLVHFSLCVFSRQVDFYALLLGSYVCLLQALMFHLLEELPAMLLKQSCTSFAKELLGFSVVVQ